MINFLESVYSFFIDAIFPLSEIEQELFSINPELALNILPKSPEIPIKATSILAYKDERVSKLIWNIKYKKYSPAIKIGGYALFETVNKMLNYSDSTTPNTTKSTPPACHDRNRAIIIPIPITKKRRKERGFNQCELLVDEMKKLDTKNTFDINKNLLIRIKHSSRQTLKHRKERLIDALGIFAINKTELEALSRKKDNYLQTKIIIIDDVITTGSTMLEAVHALEQSGFENVTAISLAH